MPSATSISRARRRHRQTASRWDAWRGALLAMIVAVSIAVGSLSAGMAYLYLDFAQNVPAVEDVSAFFGTESNPAFVPIRLYDRSGGHLLAEWSNPAAADRRWVSLDPADANAAPQVLIQAILAAQDPGFWDADGVTPVGLGIRLLRDIFPFSKARPQLSIPEQLAGTTLLPLQVYPDRSVRRDFRLALLGERLEARFDKEQILTWYLNSAYFGSLASGADAAALVYFGKHAGQLDLAESALLAGIPGDPGASPIQSPSDAKRRQGEVISRMLRLGFINQRQASAARAEKLDFSTNSSGEVNSPRADLSALVLARFEQRFGVEAAGRGGIKIITSVDHDLQLQAECTLETHLARMSGEPPGTVLPAEANQPCLAAGFLPPIRPGDSNVDHEVASGAALISDPTTGQLLALANLPGGDPAGLSYHPAGQVLSPFVYLTAFARGYAPGSMILDLPSGGALTDSGGQAYHGPVRMRTALANVYPQASARALQLVGEDNVGRTARQLGIQPPAIQAAPAGVGGNLTGQASLLDLSLAYSVLANSGEMSVVRAISGQGPEGSLSPGVILRVEDVYGHSTYEEETSQRSVVSPQLAYLINNVLSDDPARWPSLGQGNVFDVGLPVASLSSVDPEESGNWTIGYTPDMTVGVWIGNQNHSPMEHVDRVNGSAPVWRALILYATRELPRSDWTMPAGIDQVDVCDPSGLLPTEYCPQVVKEVYIQGTEPTAPDNLYQPFKIDVETGKLATLFTPLDQVEEKVFMVPPPEALAWAQSAGIDQPPQEYDAIDVKRAVDSEVHLSSPSMFAAVGGDVQLRGSARGEGFQYYRLQYGKGLNPDQWVQIGQDQARPTANGLLATWDSRGLNGLYTVQLQVVGKDGEIKADALPLTLDNLPPTVTVVAPSPSGGPAPVDAQGRVLFEVEASDAHGPARVTFEVDGNVVGSLTDPPFSLYWRPGREGDHTLVVHAFDAVGNQTTTEAIPFTISP